MVKLQWTQEEDEYFKTKIIPLSNYANGRYERGTGQSFADLGKIMQRDLQAKEESERTYDAETLYQYWYSHVRLGGNKTLKSTSTPSSSVAPQKRNAPSSKQAVGAKAVDEASQSAINDECDDCQGQADEKGKKSAAGEGNDTKDGEYAEKNSGGDREDSDKDLNQEHTDQGAAEGNEAEGEGEDDDKTEKKSRRSESEEEIRDEDESQDEDENQDGEGASSKNSKQSKSKEGKTTKHCLSESTSKDEAAVKDTANTDSGTSLLFQSNSLGYLRTVGLQSGSTSATADSERPERGAGQSSAASSSHSALVGSSTLAASSLKRGLRDSKGDESPEKSPAKRIRTIQRHNGGFLPVLELPTHGSLEDNMLAHQPRHLQSERRERRQSGSQFPQSQSYTSPYSSQGRRGTSVLAASPNGRLQFTQMIGQSSNVQATASTDLHPVSSRPYWASDFLAAPEHPTHVSRGSELALPLNPPNSAVQARGNGSHQTTQQISNATPATSTQQINQTNLQGQVQPRQGGLSGLQLQPAPSSVTAIGPPNTTPQKHEGIQTGLGQSHGAQQPNRPAPSTATTSRNQGAHQPSPSASSTAPTAHPRMIVPNPRGVQPHGVQQGQGARQPNPPTSTAPLASIPPNMQQQQQGPQWYQAAPGGGGTLFLPAAVPHVHSQMMGTTHAVHPHTAANGPFLQNGMAIYYYHYQIHCPCCSRVLGNGNGS